MDLVLLSPSRRDDGVFVSPSRRAVDALSGSAVRVSLFVRLAFEIWGAVGAVRVCTRALRCFGGPVYACALVDRRRRPEPAARPTLVSAAMWAPGCSRTEIRVRTASFAAMGRLVRCTGASPISSGRLL